MSVRENTTLIISVNGAFAAQYQVTVQHPFKHAVRVLQFVSHHWVDICRGA
jgi:hypothetical protein